ncbi:hypothetical protein ACTS9K_08410 [Empedobacter sp. ULE_I145]|uniref:hypothetical protein n=1 Tax=Empedobacter falsenii TaxID=343874 RepID=UPI001C8ECC63|nr:hypothetical protein [Empedobacter falsenii]MBY0066824.1 hypothetical protein [Empedobacter falsenii]
MKFYRGDKSGDFKIINKLSRYNFPCLFFASNIDLAIKYKEEFNGYLYEHDINVISRTIDFKGEITHSADFRNMIMKLRFEKYKSVLIKNCGDYPSNLSQLTYSDILVVFDLSIIKSTKKHS